MNRLFLLTMLSLSLIACSTPNYAPPTKPAHTVAKQQFKNPKTYYGARWVRSPAPGASAKQRTRAKEVIVKNFHYDLGNSDLCSISVALAASLKFSNYCASTLKKRFYHINKIVTPYELKAYLESVSDVKIVIDSVNREVRFLDNNVINPEFN